MEFIAVLSLERDQTSIIAHSLLAAAISGRVKLGRLPVSCRLCRTYKA
jgi:hypothetical protein